MPKAWVIHGYRGYQGLSLEEVPDVAPGPGEVRLRVEAFALNWGDMDLMHDRYSFSFSGVSGLHRDGSGRNRWMRSDPV